MKYIRGAQAYGCPLVLASALYVSWGCTPMRVYHFHKLGMAGEGGDSTENAAGSVGQNESGRNTGGRAGTAGRGIGPSSGGTSNRGLGGETDAAGRDSSTGGDASGAGGQSTQVDDGGQSGTTGEAGAPPASNPLCGNGVLDDGETCDDDNTTNGDGCSSRCVVESKFSCTGAPSVCIPLSSCAGMIGSECAGDDCCASPQVTGGTFFQGDDPGFYSTVSTFRLDEFEVTVGRFRRFVAAYDGWRTLHPQAGEGRHPRLSSGSGWDSSYDSQLPQNASALKSDISCDEMFQTWSNDTARDPLPINCVNWYEAFAFCVWDGGRLPTESEWEYAAAGGNADTIYPWGDSPAPDDIDGSYAVYNCLGNGLTDCVFADIQPVGSRPAGMGQYGQLDLAGSMWEWALDSYAAYPTSDAANYANLDGGSGRVSRGGDWYNRAHYYLRAKYRTGGDPTYRNWTFGIRCARDL